VLFYQVCADTVKANQSRAQHNMGAGYAFFAHQTSWPLNFWSWKWCPSPVWRGKRRFRVVVSILFFLGLSVLDLGPICATDGRQTSDAHHRLCLRHTGAVYNSCYCLT